MKEAPHQGRPDPCAHDGVTDRSPQFGEVLRTEVPEIVHLEMRPTVLIRIELGRVRRKVFEMKSTLAGQYQLPNAIRPVGLVVVPDKDHGAANVSEEMENELTADLRVDRPLFDHEEELTFRGDRGDGGELGPAVVVAKDRGLSSECPSLADEGDQGDRRLVREDDGRAELVGFFLMAGHRWRTQA